MQAGQIFLDFVITVIENTLAQLIHTFRQTPEFTIFYHPSHVNFLCILLCVFSDQIDLSY